MRMFGRPVWLAPGMIVLAMRARAPLVRCWFRWLDDESGRRDDRVVLQFDEPIEYPSEGNREQVVGAGVQDWCDRCTAYMSKHPENWMFWLDKGWTRVLRAA